MLSFCGFLTTLCINILSLKIDEFGKPDDPNWQPNWVIEAIKQTPSLKESNPISKYCQQLTVFSAITFPGKLCFVSVWRDVSLLEIKADPRRKFCETLSWGHLSEFKEFEICTVLDKSTSNCHGNYDLHLQTIGYIPTLCPQFPQRPCQDFKTLRSATSFTPHNQIVNTHQPNDTSGNNINTTVFDSSNLGYIRVSANEKIYHSSDDCPSHMYGISYYWSESRMKSCTVLSKDENIYSEPESTLLQQHCRDNSEEQFLGCVYTSEGNCLSALEQPEYIGIVEPEKLSVNINIFIEAEYVGEETHYSGARGDKKIEQTMANANSADDSEFKISTTINIAQFAFSFSEISSNFRLCSDELFNLQSFIPGLNPETTVKFCLRATDWKTFMPENGKLYVQFVPHFTATLRKRSSMSSLGFSGGIEYTAHPFVAFLDLQKPTNWLNRPDKNAVTRQDLRWYKPMVIRDRNEYKRPTDLTMIVLAVFLGGMGVYIVFMAKGYLSLKREEELHLKAEQARIRMDEITKKEHAQWERNILEKDKKFNAELKGFKERQSQKLLTDDQLIQRISEISEKNKISIVSDDQTEDAELRKSKLEQYSDIQISEEELNELMQDSSENSEKINK